MTPKQEAFVNEYLVDLNATKAAMRAGYSAKTAASQGERLLRNVEITRALQGARKAREERTQITQDRVLQELARIAFFDIRKLYREDGSLKAINELDDDAAAVLSGVDVTSVSIGDSEDASTIATKKAKIFDKTGALQLAMRHLGMLKDKIEHSGTIGIADRIRMNREKRVQRDA